MFYKTWKFIKLQWHKYLTLHPLLRGSITYAVLYPAGSFIQQTLEGKTLKTYDCMRLLRFSIYGSLYVAPTLYGWIKLSSIMWPHMNLKNGLIKAAVEQVSYAPFACCSFFLFMSLLEGKTLTQSIDEVKLKFLPTYQIGLCVWPIIQTINFTLIPEKHRLVVVSVSSLIWTTFLAIMKREEVRYNSEFCYYIYNTSNKK